MTCEASSSATSSPESQAGRLPSSSPAGPMTVPSGPAHAPVNRSPSPDERPASPMSVISGLSGDISSRSASLQSSLENRLRERLNGSPLCEVAWKPWATPWGQSLSRPLARVRTTFGIVIGLWPTVTIFGNTNRVGASKNSGDGLRTKLVSTAIAMWPTLTARDHKSRSASDTTLNRNSRPLSELIFAFWPTLRATDGAKGGPNMKFGAGGQPLPYAVSTAARSSNAPMENGAGSLHPEFAGWELGYPPEYLKCAPSETPST